MPSPPTPAGRGPWRASTVAAAIAVYLASVGNLALWRALAAGPSPASWPVRVAVFLALLAVLVGLLQALALPWIFKPSCVLLLLLSAVASSAMLDYGVVMDESLLRNVLQTDAPEAAELVSPRAVLFVLALGALPAVLVLRLRLAYGPPVRELRRRAALVAGPGVLALAVAWPSYADLAGVSRANPRLQLLVNPITPLATLASYGRGPPAAPAVPQPVATDAHRPAAGPGARRTLLVLVLGETATAGHFAFNGYARDTNPELRARGVLNFPHVTACGTSTADVLPCLFAAHAAGEDPADPEEGRENLLDVLQRVGIGVLWRDNNSGCKGVCARVPYEEVHAPPELRSGPNPWDGALVTGLREILASAPGDQFIVLHQKGSHGPAYHRRTPPEFKRFLPECTSDDLQSCEREAVVNAYDNTILYTDHVLAQVIDLLREFEGEADTGLLYVSDHGESLGEGGVWLHGLPAFLAPDEQTHVPMIFWGSPGLLASRGLTPPVLEAAASAAWTHASVFHTVLGLLGVSSATWEPELDVFAAARPR